jgi:DNA polymerase-1
MMTRPDGTPVNAVYGFTTMLMKLMETIHNQYVVVIFDAGRETFRNKIYPAYKAQRPPAPDELIPQFALIRDAVNAFNVPSLEREGYEADDLIASYVKLARSKDIKVTIISSDKDLMQLISTGVEMYDPLKNKTIKEPEVFEKFAVPPSKVIDVQALAGDPTDNVPGVPGIGLKIAAQLIQEYGDLENLLLKASEIKQEKRRESLINYAENARISKQLVTLKDDISDLPQIESLRLTPPNSDRLQRFLEEQNFRSIKAKLSHLFVQSPHDENQSIKTTPVEPIHYELITNIAQLNQWIEKIKDKGFVAFDTETTSLNPQTADLVGFSLSFSPRQACYVPLMNGGLLGVSDLIPINLAIEILTPILQDKTILKIGHNIKFDMAIMRKFSITISPIDDTMLMSYILNCGSHGQGMDELALKYLSYKTTSYNEVCGTGKGKVTFDQVPLNIACQYASEDADITLQLYRLLKSKLIQEHLTTPYETLERPLIPIISEMEYHGIKVDQSELRLLSNDFGQRMSGLEKEVQDLAGHSFNLSSAKQLGEVLFEKLALKGGKKTAKSGAWATDAEVLEELASQHPLPAKLLEWRQLAKLKSTYSDSLLSQINPYTGRVHTSYSLAGTSTGRLASSDPNLQNIPIRTEDGKRIRRAFIAEPETLLMSADYSQIELRLVAHVANISGLKQAFEDGDDIHSITASQVFGVPLKDIDKETRRRAKAINFGIIYGISAYGLARQLSISNSDAKNYIDAYFLRYPEIKNYMEKTILQAKTNGYVSTLFGRRCYVKGINEKNPSLRNFAERAAINAPIQGGAADIIKRAMIRLPQALKSSDLSAKMLLQVHDELVFEVPKNEIEKTKEVVKKIMESSTTLSVPLVVDIGVGSNWAEAH